MKQKFLLLILAAAVTVFFAGCGDDSGTSSKGSESSEKDDEKTSSSEDLDVECDDEYASAKLLYKETRTLYECIDGHWVPYSNASEYSSSSEKSSSSKRASVFDDDESEKSDVNNDDEADDVKTSSSKTTSSSFGAVSSSSRESSSDDGVTVAVGDPCDAKLVGSYIFFPSDTLLCRNGKWEKVKDVGSSDSNGSDNLNKSSNSNNSGVSSSVAGFEELSGIAKMLESAEWKFYEATENHCETSGTETIDEESGFPSASVSVSCEEGVTSAFAGFGAPEDPLHPIAYNITDWEGVCIAYKSNVDLLMRMDGNTRKLIMGFGTADIPLSATDEVKIVNRIWGTIELSKNNSMMSVGRITDNLEKIYFISNDANAEYEILKIDAFGECGPISAEDKTIMKKYAELGRQREEIKTVYGSDVSLEHEYNWIWFDYRVITGFDDESVVSGYWFEGGENGEIIYPVGRGKGLGDDAIDPIIDLCQGLCGMANVEENGKAYVGFYLTESVESGADCSSWGSVQIAYVSKNSPMTVVLYAADGLYASYELPASDIMREVNIPLKNFVPSREGVDIEDITTKLSIFQIEFNQEGENVFNIRALGWGNSWPELVSEE